MRRILSIVTWLVLSALWTGCIRSDFESPESPQGQNMTLTVKVLLPGSSSNDTRSETETTPPASETDINQLDLVIFKNTGEEDESGNPIFTYRSHHTGTISPTGGIQTYQFRDVYTSEHDDCFLAFIANAHDDVEAALNTVNENDEMNTVLDKLVFSTQKGWMEERSKNINLMPMYGQISNMLLHESMGTMLFSVPMLRSVARVDVLNTVTPTPDDGQTSQPLPPLGIKEVRVVNTMNQSSLIPNRDESFNESDPELIGVTAPNIPKNAQRLKVAEAITKQGTLIQTQPQNTEDNTDNTTEGNTYESAITGIYVSESAAGGSHLERNCLLINIPQEVNEQTKDCWYRVDLKAAPQGGTPSNMILRNHHYVITINSITGFGFDTPDEAFDNVSVGLECNIEDWEMGMNQDITLPNTFLELDPSVVTIYNNDETPITLSLKRNYAHENYIFFINSDNPVCSVVGWSDDVTKEQIKIDEIKWDGIDPGESRSGYFYIQFGDGSDEYPIELKKLVPITLINTPNPNGLSLQLSPETVYFPLSPTSAQTITATYSPNDANLSMKITNSTITWVDTPKLHGNLVSLLPEKFESAAEGQTRTATLTFTLTSADTQTTISKSVKVIQSGEGAFFMVDPHDKISSEETDVTFTVKSAVDWSLMESTIINGDVDPTEPIDLVKWDKELQLANESGANYTVTVPANQTWAERTWYFVPTSEHEAWPLPSDALGIVTDVSELPYGTWTVVQSAATPALEVTPTTVDFGAGSEPARIPVTISTNAKWYYTLPSTNTWVVGTAEVSYAPTEENDNTFGTDTPATTNEYDIYFSSTTFGIDASNTLPENVTIPAYGSQTATVTFKTAATDSNDEKLASQASKKVTFKRTVPGFLRPLPGEAGLDVYPFELVGTEGTVTLQFQTNAPWEAGYIVNGEETLVKGASDKADTFGARSTKLTIQDDSEWLLPIPSPNVNLRPYEIFVRPKQGTVMAENEPSKLSYNLNVDKYYLNKAELRIDDKLISPNATTSMAYKEGEYKLDVAITGHFENKTLRWPNTLEEADIDTITLKDGATYNGTRYIASLTGWGYKTYEVYLTHGYIKPNEYNGIYVLGRFNIRGFGGYLNGPSLIPADTSSFKIKLTASSGWRSPLEDINNPPQLYVTGRHPQYGDISMQISPTSHDTKTATYHVTVGANKLVEGQKPAEGTYHCAIKDSPDGSEQLWLDVTHVKPDDRLLVEIPGREGTYMLVRVQGGYPGHVQGSIAKTVPSSSGCTQIEYLNKGDRIKLKAGALAMVDKFAASTFKRGPWLFSKGQYNGTDSPTYAFWVSTGNASTTWLPRFAFNNGPRATVKKVSEDTLEITNYPNRNNPSTTWTETDMHNVWWEDSESYVVCKVKDE